MASKLTQKQKAGLIFGGAALVALLMIGRAEGAFETEKKKLPPPRKMPPLGQKGVGPAPHFEPGGYEYQGGASTTLPAGCNAATASKLPEITQHEIGVSCDYSQAKIGDFWVLSVLHPFLDRERQEGRLATYDHNAGSIADFLYNDPVAFINRQLGTSSTGVTVGDAVYITAWLIATGGGVLPRVGAKLAGAVETVSGSEMIGATLPYAAQTAVELGGPAIFISGMNEFVEGLYTDLHVEAMDSGEAIWDDKEEMRTVLNQLLVSAVEAFGKLIETRSCIWGFEQRKSVKLVDLPYIDHPRVYMMFQDIFKEILKFQRRDFTWDPEDVTPHPLLPYFPDWL